MPRGTQLGRGDQEWGWGHAYAACRGLSLLVGVQVDAVGTVQFLGISEVLAETQSKIPRGELLRKTELCGLFSFCLSWCLSHRYRESSFFSGVTFKLDTSKLLRFCTLSNP